MLALQRSLESLCAAILLYFDTIRKEALSVRLSLQTTHYSANMITTGILLKDAEHSLLCGDPVADVPELARVCVLLRMLEPDKVLTAYQSHLRKSKRLRQSVRPSCSNGWLKNTPWLSR